jgi:hypothetical protein
MSPILRILAPAAMLFLLATTNARAQATIQVGTLEAGDSTLDGGGRFDEYAVDVTAGREVVAIVTSVDFDPYVIAIPPAGEQIEVDDYGDSRDVAVLEEIAAEGGSWLIRVTSYESGESGEYALVLTTRQRTDAIQTEEDFIVTGALPAGGEATPISGTLAEGDQVRDDDSWYDGWSLDVEEGEHIVIVLGSPDFDAYLTLVSPSGRAFNNDDDGQGGTDSRLDMVVDEAGRWTVVANTLNPGDTGAYRLSVERP